MAPEQITDRSLWIRGRLSRVSRPIALAFHPSLFTPVACAFLFVAVGACGRPLHEADVRTPSNAKHLVAIGAPLSTDCVTAPAMRELFLDSEQAGGPLLWAKLQAAWPKPEESRSAIKAKVCYLGLHFTRFVGEVSVVTGFKVDVSNGEGQNRSRIFKVFHFSKDRSETDLAGEALTKGLSAASDWINEAAVTFPARERQLGDHADDRLPVARIHLSETQHPFDVIPMPVVPQEGNRVLAEYMPLSYFLFFYEETRGDVINQLVPPAYSPPALQGFVFQYAKSRGWPVPEGLNYGPQ